jgi:hypothetical protein
VLAKSNGLVVVPSPVNLAVTLTFDSVVVGSAGTHALPFHTNIWSDAVPFGTVPVIVTLPAFVNLPCASTVNVPTCVALP